MLHFLTTSLLPAFAGLLTIFFVFGWLLVFVSLFFGVRVLGSFLGTLLFWPQIGRDCICLPPVLRLFWLVLPACFSGCSLLLGCVCLGCLPPCLSASVCMVGGGPLFRFN